MQQTLLRLERFLIPLALALICGITAHAQDFTYQGINYTVLTDNTCETKQGTRYTGGNDVSGDVVIPATVLDENDNEYTVTAIGDYSFKDCVFSSLEIPNSVISIGHSAFVWCTLSSVEIPNSVTSIGIAAFIETTNLETVTIGESVTFIGVSAFNVCYVLKEVTILGSPYIDLGAFTETAIESVTALSTNPVAIHDEAFDDWGYENATLYVPESAVETYKSTDGWKNFKNIVGIPITAEVGDVCVDNADGAIVAEDGAICINGDGNVQVIALNGETVYNGRGNVRFNVAPGVYLIKTAHKTSKIIVR